MATYFRLLDPMRQFLDENGDPYSGGKLYTYTAGTESEKATYKDSAGSTQHANPIVLDSAGRVPDEVWGTTGAYKLALYTSGDVLIDAPDNIDGINDASASVGSEWVSSGLAPTYVSASSFTFEGDQTDVFHYGRRLLLADSSTLYGYVSSSSYSDPNTTVGVTLDSGSLSASLSAVSYGLISVTDTSSPDSLIKIASGVANAVSSFEITDLSSIYRSYILDFSNLVSVTDNVTLEMQVSTDNGSTYKSGATDYAYGVSSIAETGTVSGAGSAGDTQIDVLGARGNHVLEESAGRFLILDPANAGTHTQIIYDIVGQSRVPEFARSFGGGQYQTSGATNAVRLQFSSGNISTMSYTLYGVRA